MPETLLLAVALALAGTIVLLPLWRDARPPADGDDERAAAEVRHRVALEALRDVETDRRAGSLDGASYERAMLEAETRAIETRAALDAGPRSAGVGGPSPASRTVPVAAAGLICAALLLGSLVPSAGIANETVVDEALAAAEAAELERQHRIDELTEAFAANPDDPEVLSELADAYLAGTSGRDLAAAAAALQLLIALEPDRADAYERIISAYIRADDFGNARAALTGYDGLASADAVEVAFLDGLIALRGEGDRERAAEAFDRFLELAPDDPRAPMIEALRSEAGSGS